jgi:prepilin-type N-terminal cleavage/methylation domain-containing protein
MKKDTSTTRLRFGFTLVELMVVISVIGILSAIVYASFGDSRKIARDDVRKTDLKNLQVALALYKAQNGTYPIPGCTGGTWYGPGTVTTGGVITNPVDCSNYIANLVPDFIAVLPNDPSSEKTNNTGIFYRSDGTNYKLMYFNSVEVNTITDGSIDFARCPDFGSCGGNATNRAKTYAVYSAGASTW